MNEIVAWFIDLVTNIDPTVRVAIAGLAIFLETSFLVGLVAPGDTIVFVAATGVRTPIDYITLVIVITVGALLGESLGFLLGQTVGRKIRDSRIGQRVIGSWWHVAESYIDRRGGVAVFLSRFLPVLHSVVPLVCGMSRMRYRTFLAWTAPACVLWTFIYVTVGFLLAEQFEIFSSTFKGAGWVFLTGVVIFIVVTHVVKKRLTKREIGDVSPSRPEDGKSDRTSS